MKKTILLLTTLMFLFLTPVTQPQSVKIKTEYLLIQPVDFGIGHRLDIGFSTTDLQLYESISYGNWGLYRQNGIRDHIKFTIGLMHALKPHTNEKTLSTDQFFITFGLNYHLLTKYAEPDIPLDSDIFNPWSFELGITAYSWKKVAIGIRTDILRWEPCMDFGYRF